MKIAMIIDAWDPIIGGGQVHVKNICEKLIKNHHCEIDLFVRALKNENGEIFDTDETFFDGKLRIIRCGRAKDFFYFPERILSIFSLSFTVIKQNKTKKYDLVHAHSFLGLFSGKISSKFIKRPFVGTVHGANLLDKGSKTFYYFIEKFLLTKIVYDTLISVGSSFFQYQNINKNIVIIPNGVDIQEFENVTGGKNKDIFKVLFVGRFEWTKGIDILIQAIAGIDRKLLDEKRVQIHLIGYGYEEEQYKKLVQELGLEKYILFRGKITGQELIQEYKTSDLYVLPSRTEGFGMTILEAMAAGVPVIATKCGGPEDIIQDGENGFLVQKENSELLKDKIIQFLNHDTDLETIIIEGKRTAQKYSWGYVASKTHEQYKKHVS